MTPAPAPKGLGPSGRALWRRVAAVYELRPDEREALASACRLRDELARMERTLSRAPVVVAGSTGQPRPHPLFDAVRRHRAALSAQLAKVGLADAEREASAEEPSPVSLKARRAAETRWRRDRGETA